MLATVDRPLTGWGQRYVKAHIQLMTKDEIYQWFLAIDEFGYSLKDYVESPSFIDAPVNQQKTFLDEFADMWNLPYGDGLIQLLHRYQHIYDINIFVEAWKAFYYRSNGYFSVQITTPSLLKENDVDIVLQTLSIPKDKCILTQTISPKLLGGLIVECHGVRYDTSVLGQLQMIKRNLCDDSSTL